jgi:Rrf2 family nitric oxide-sensitive transcriptional repressor
LSGRFYDAVWPVVDFVVLGSGKKSRRTGDKKYKTVFLVGVRESHARGQSQMRITAYSNYALRTLMYAALKGDELSRVKDIAEAYNISKAHLVKCVHQLGQWGYLDNYRGRNGGFKLAKPPSEITVGEVLRKTEDGFDLVECFVPASSTCPLTSLCELSNTLQRALIAFLEVVDDVTVEDLVAGRRELMEALNLATEKVDS